MNYQVINSGHGHDLILVAHNANKIMIRIFDRYTGPIDDKTVMTPETIYSDLSDYPAGMNTILVFNGVTYGLVWSRQLTWNESQIQAGGTYAVIDDYGNNRVIRLDSEKYPDFDTSDWKWIRARSYRLMLKFHVFSIAKNFNDINWVFYLNGGYESTVFAFEGEINPIPCNDSETNILPEFNYSISDNRVLTLTSDSNVSGPIKIEEHIGRFGSLVANMVNGVSTQIKLPDNESKFRVLFGFNEVLVIDERN